MWKTWCEENELILLWPWLRRGLVGLGSRVFQRLVGSGCGYALDARFRCDPSGSAGPWRGRQQTAAMSLTPSAVRV